MQITARSSPTHGLERRLVRFLRLPRATLCRFSCLIPEGCRPDPAGFSGPYSSVLCLPFDGHCCRPSALDTSTTTLTALKSTSCSIVGLSLGDRSILRAAQPHIRHIVPWPALRASSELVLPSPSRPAQQTCPSACPCPGSSPITRRFADHAHPGGLLNRPFCARPVADAAALYCARQGHLVSRLVTTGWAVVVSPPPGLCSRRCSSVSGCRMRCGASVTCAPLRRRQMACCSRACPYPAAALLCHLGPLLHFKKSASGCCQPPPPAGGPLAADLSNCTRRISVGDGRVAAGVSELGPAMSDGESVPDEL